MVSSRIALCLLATLATCSLAFVNHGIRRFQTNMNIKMAEQKPFGGVNVPKLVSALVAGLCSTGILVDPSLAAGTGSKTYLTEPTSEFKDEEKKVADFNKAQAKIRQEWDAIIGRLEKTEDAATTEAVMKDLKGVLTKYDQGIPRGVKKQELVKLARSKKYVLKGRKQIQLPTWSTDTEIAYQALIQEFNRQVLPNNREARSTE